MYIGLSKKYSHHPTNGLRDTIFAADGFPSFKWGIINNISSFVNLSESPNSNASSFNGIAVFKIPKPVVES